MSFHWFTYLFYLFYYLFACFTYSLTISIGLFLLNRIVLLFSKFCSVACYSSLIRGYFYYYLYMFDRIIMLNTSSFIPYSSLLIYSVNYLVFYPSHVAS